MSDTVNQRRPLPNIGVEEETDIKTAFRNADTDRLVGLPAIIAKAVEVFGTKERESRTKESFENIKVSRTIEQNERLAAALGNLQRNQEKSVGLLEELLRTVKGQRENRRTLGFIDNLFTSLPFRNILKAAGVFLGGATIVATMRALLGDDEEIQQREDLLQQQRDETRRQGDAALVPREPLSEELQPIIARIVENANSEEEVIERAGILANSYTYDSGTAEYETIVESARTAYQQRIAGGAAPGLPIPPIPPRVQIPVGEEPLPVPPVPPPLPTPPVPPRQITIPQVQQPQLLPVPPVPPPLPTPPVPPRSMGGGYTVTGEDASKAGVLTPRGTVVPLPPEQALPLSQIPQQITDLLVPASQTIMNDAAAANDINDDPEEIVRKIVEQREEISKAVETNPDLFSNRLLNIRARKIVLKSDEFEFLNSGVISPGLSDTSGYATPAANMGGMGSTITQAITGGASGGGGQQGQQNQNVSLTTVRTRSGQTAQVNIDSAAQFQGFINDLEDSGYAIRSLGGYAFRRNVNNPNILSTHATGHAIDINPEQNPNRSTRTDMPVDLVQQLIRKWGLGWGMNWQSVQDPMHFSTSPREGGRIGGGTGGSQVPSEIPTGGDTIQASNPMTTASPVTTSPTSGAQVANASQENAVADRTPAPPSVVTTGTEAAPQGPNPSVGAPDYFSSPNDPGNVEPADAAERYARLFNMAA